MKRETKADLRKRGYSEESIKQIDNGFKQAKVGKLKPMKPLLDKYKPLEDHIEEE